MKVTMIVVLYKTSIAECKTLQTLQETAFFNQNNENIHVLVYDHSPDKQEAKDFPVDARQWTYIHDPRNLGLATAYNEAYTRAKEHGSDWLLLLDHDTELTPEYAEKVLALPDMAEEVVTVVPKVVFGETLISPVFSDTFRPLKEQRPEVGLQDKPVMAINSGSLVRMAFLDEIDGFNEVFPLDYLDHWLFYEVYKRGYKTFVLDVLLSHDLSVMDYSRVSLNRYKSILQSETLFYQLYKKEHLAAYKQQLWKRLAKQVITVRNKRIALVTLKKILTL